MNVINRNFYQLEASMMASLNWSIEIVSPVDEIWTLADSFAKTASMDQASFESLALVIAPARGSLKTIRIVSSSDHLETRLFNMTTGQFEPLASLAVIRLKPLTYEHIFTVSVRPLQALLFSFKGKKEFKCKEGLKATAFLFTRPDIVSINTS